MRTIITTLLAATALVACQDTPEPRADAAPSAATQVAAALESDADVVVYKSPTCGCCSGWIEHLREAGYSVEAVDIVQYADLRAVKDREGVPGDLGSCHTAVIDGYTVEGHVPADVIARLLEERPDIRGIAVPGMPAGSPGMEGPNPERYQVIAFTESGEREVFETVDPTAD